MQDTLDAIFENLASPSQDAHSLAMDQLKTLLFSCCAAEQTNKHSLEVFLTLQAGFEYNVITRLFTWLTANARDERNLPVSLITQALVIMQGLALIHPASKRFMGRKQTLKILLELLSKARHPSQAPPSELISALASTVIDTFLCILVDCPELIRVFEDINGMEVIVKLLKRGGIAREVRMKCLEFLYFYLLDESSPGNSTAAFGSSSSGEGSNASSEMHQTPSRKNSRPIFATPRPSSRVISSFEPGSPTKRTSGSPSKRTHAYAMLRQDVDFVPTSPVKQRYVESAPHTPRAKSKTQLSPYMIREQPHYEQDQVLVAVENEDPSPRGHEKKLTKSSREKREILGGLLGNVDVLVDGVGKAGIFGLT